MIHDIKTISLVNSLSSTNTDGSVRSRRTWGMLCIIVSLIGILFGGCEYQGIETIDAADTDAITVDSDENTDAGSPDIIEVDTIPLAPLCSETADDRLGGCTFKSCTCDDDSTHALCWLQDFGGNEVYTRNCITRHGQLCVPVGTCRCTK